MGRIRRIGRTSVLHVLPMDHDVVKGDPWSEGVFDVFLSVLGRFWSFFGCFLSFLSFWGEAHVASGEDNEDSCPHCPPYGSRYSERRPVERGRF